MVSLIQQDVFVFDASIRDNITMFHGFPKEAVDAAIGRSELTGLLLERGRTTDAGKTAAVCPGARSSAFPLPAACCAILLYFWQMKPRRPWTRRQPTM